MHTNSRLLFEKHATQYFKSGMKVLEIGPDGFPSTYQRIVSDSSIVWHTLDIRDDPSLTFRTRSEYDFPIESGCYDIVLSGQVIEHVRKIWLWVCELARVCKTGGLVVTINPVSWPYHEAPIDCWRIFPDGMKALYEHASLKVRSSLCECLEAARMPHLPGRSAEWQPPRLRRAYKVLSMVGFPIECAYDVITVGEKL